MYYILFLIIILFITIRKYRREKWSNIQSDNYFSFFNEFDFSFRKCYNIDECKKIYSNSELELTPFEKKKIKKIIEDFLNKINFRFKFIFKNLSIIKVKNSIENSLPHTRGKHIIFSQYWIDKFLENNNHLYLQKLISHEQFHIYQRYNPKKMEELYIKYWNMEKLKKNLPKEISEINRTNPDALPDNNWLFKREKDLILPLCLYKKNAKSMMDTDNIYLRLDKNHDFLNLTEDLSNRKLLINESSYRNFFGNEMSNNYHANELSASIFELIIEDIILGKTNKRFPAYNQLKKFLDSQN